MSSPASVSFEKGGRSERYANPPYALSIRVSGAGGCVGADGGTQRQPSTSLNSNERKELLVGEVPTGEQLFYLSFDEFRPSRRYGCLRFELMVGEESNRETTRLEGKGCGAPAEKSLNG